MFDYQNQSDCKSNSSKRSDKTYSCFEYLPPQYHALIDYHRAPTDPILQNNVKDKPFRPIFKQSTQELQKSVIFDLNSQERIKKEYRWRPQIKQCENFANQMSFKTYDVHPIGKSRQNYQNLIPNRNPILQGDENSYFTRKQRVRTEFAPVDQIVNF